MSEIEDLVLPEDRTHRSVSQANQWSRCPYQFYLARIEKVWQIPAAWLPQGLAVHEAVEAFEKSLRQMSLEEMQEIFRVSYIDHTNRLSEETPNWDYWFASGPYRAEEDITRRFHIGRDQVARYFEYTKKTEENIWTQPDGSPAVEFSFEMDLDGVPVRGYADQIVETPGGGLIIRDIKTGRLPGDELQLAVYATAANELFGVSITRGDYWMARAGGPTIPYDLSEWTRDKVIEEFRVLDDNITEGRFEAKPEPSKCRFCSVHNSCEFSMA